MINETESDSKSEQENKTESVRKKTLKKTKMKSKFNKTVEPRLLKNKRWAKQAQRLLENEQQEEEEEHPILRVVKTHHLSERIQNRIAKLPKLKGIKVIADTDSGATWISCGILYVLSKTEGRIIWASSISRAPSDIVNAVGTLLAHSPSGQEECESATRVFRNYDDTIPSTSQQQHVMTFSEVCELATVPKPQETDRGLMWYKIHIDRYKRDPTPIREGNMMRMYTHYRTAVLLSEDEDLPKPIQDRFWKHAYPNDHFLAKTTSAMRKVVRACNINKTDSTKCVKQMQQTLFLANRLGLTSAQKEELARTIVESSKLAYTLEGQETPPSLQHSSLAGPPTATARSGIAPIRDAIIGAVKQYCLTNKILFATDMTAHIFSVITNIIAAAISSDRSVKVLLTVNIIVSAVSIIVSLILYNKGKDALTQYEEEIERLRELTTQAVMSSVVPSEDDDTESYSTPDVESISEDMKDALKKSIINGTTSSSAIANNMIDGIAKNAERLENMKRIAQKDVRDIVKSVTEKSDKKVIEYLDAMKRYQEEDSDDEYQDSVEEFVHTVHTTSDMMKTIKTQTIVNTNTKDSAKTESITVTRVTENAEKSVETPSQEESTPPQEKKEVEAPPQEEGTPQKEKEETPEKKEEDSASDTSESKKEKKYGFHLCTPKCNRRQVSNTEVTWLPYNPENLGKMLFKQLPEDFSKWCGDRNMMTVLRQLGLNIYETKKPACPYGIFVDKQKTLIGTVLKSPGPIIPGLVIAQHGNITMTPWGGSISGCMLEKTDEAGLRWVKYHNIVVKQVHRQLLHYINKPYVRDDLCFQMIDNVRFPEATARSESDNIHNAIKTVVGVILVAGATITVGAQPTIKPTEILGIANGTATLTKNVSQAVDWVTGAVDQLNVPSKSALSARFEKIMKDQRWISAIPPSFIANKNPFYCAKIKEHDNEIYALLKDLEQHKRTTATTTYSQMLGRCIERNSEIMKQAGTSFLAGLTRPAATFFQITGPHGLGKSYSFSTNGKIYKDLRDMIGPVGFFNAKQDPKGYFREYDGSCIGVCDEFLALGTEDPLIPLVNSLSSQTGANLEAAFVKNVPSNLLGVFCLSNTEDVKLKHLTVPAQKAFWSRMVSYVVTPNDQQAAALKVSRYAKVDKDPSTWNWYRLKRDISGETNTIEIKREYQPITYKDFLYDVVLSMYGEWSKVNGSTTLEDKYYEIEAAASIGRTTPKFQPLPPYEHRIPCHLDHSYGEMIQTPTAHARHSEQHMVLHLNGEPDVGKSYFANLMKNRFFSINAHADVYDLSATDLDNDRNEYKAGDVVILNDVMPFYQSHYVAWWEKLKVPVMIVLTSNMKFGSMGRLHRAFNAIKTLTVEGLVQEIWYLKDPPLQGPGVYRRIGVDRAIQDNNGTVILPNKNTAHFVEFVRRGIVRYRGNTMGMDELFSQICNSYTNWRETQWEHVSIHDVTYQPEGDFDIVITSTGWDHLKAMLSGLSSMSQNLGTDPLSRIYVPQKVQEQMIAKGNAAVRMWQIPADAQPESLPDLITGIRASLSQIGNYSVKVIVGDDLYWSSGSPVVCHYTKDQIPFRAKEIIHEGEEYVELTWMSKMPPLPSQAEMFAALEDWYQVSDLSSIFPNLGRQLTDGYENPDGFDYRSQYTAILQDKYTYVMRVPAKEIANGLFHGFAYMTEAPKLFTHNYDTKWTNVLKNNEQIILSLTTVMTQYAKCQVDQDHLDRVKARLTLRDHIHVQIKQHPLVWGIFFGVTALTAAYLAWSTAKGLYNWIRSSNVDCLVCNKTVTQKHYEKNQEWGDKWMRCYHCKVCVYEDTISLAQLTALKARPDIEHLMLRSLVLKVRDDITKENEAQKATPKFDSSKDPAEDHPAKRKEVRVMGQRPAPYRDPHEGTPWNESWDEGDGNWATVRAIRSIMQQDTTATPRMCPGRKVTDNIEMSVIGFLQKARVRVSFRLDTVDGIMIKDHYLIAPSHIIWLNGEKFDPTETLEVIDYTADGTAIYYSAVVERVYVDRDLMLCRITNPEHPKSKNLIPYFAKNSDLAKTVGMRAVLWETFKDKTIYDGTGHFSGVNYSPSIIQQKKGIEQEVKNVLYFTTYTINYKNSPFAVDGTCGSPYLLKPGVAGAHHRIICGIHIATMNNTNMPVGAIVTKEVLDQLMYLATAKSVDREVPMVQLNDQVYALTESTEHLVREIKTEQKPVVRVESPTITCVGRLNCHHKPEDKIKKTPFFDLVNRHKKCNVTVVTSHYTPEQIEYGEYRLDNKGRPCAISTEMCRYGEDPQYSTPEYLAAMYYTEGVLKSQFGDNNAPLNMHEVLNGFHGDNLGGLHRSSSSGPATQKLRKRMTKGEFLTSDAIVRFKPDSQSQALYREVSDFIMKLADGHVLLTTTSARIKHEVLPTEKAIRGKKRLFECSDMVPVIVQKMYFGRIVNGLKPGTNLASGFDVASMMTALDPQYNQYPSFVDLDRKKFDKHISQQDIIVGLWILTSLTTMEEPLRSAFVATFSQTLCHAGDGVYMLQNGLHSGEFATNLLGSVVSMLHGHYAYLRARNAHPGNFLDVLRDVNVVACGDDVEIMTKDETRPDIKKLIDAMNDSGVHTTPASKNESEDIQWKHWPEDGRQFLSRTIEKTGTVVRAKLNVDSICKSLFYSRVGDYSQYKEQLDAAAREMALHGKQAYDSFIRDIVKPGYELLGVREYPPAYSTQMKYYNMRALESTGHDYTISLPPEVIDKINAITGNETTVPVVDRIRAIKREQIREFHYATPRGKKSLGSHAHVAKGHESSIIRANTMSVYFSDKICGLAARQLTGTNNVAFDKNGFNTEGIKTEGGFHAVDVHAYHILAHLSRVTSVHDGKETMSSTMKLDQLSQVWPFLKYEATYSTEGGSHICKLKIDIQKTWADEMTFEATADTKMNALLAASTKALNALMPYIGYGAIIQDYKLPSWCFVQRTDTDFESARLSYQKMTSKKATAHSISTKAGLSFTANGAQGSNLQPVPGGVPAFYLGASGNMTSFLSLADRKWLVSTVTIPSSVPEGELILDVNWNDFINKHPWIKDMNAKHNNRSGSPVLTIETSSQVGIMGIIQIYIEYPDKDGNFKSGFDRDVAQIHWFQNVQASEAMSPSIKIPVVSQSELWQKQEGPSMVQPRLRAGVLQAISGVNTTVGDTGIYINLWMHPGDMEWSNIILPTLAGEPNASPLAKTADLKDILGGPTTAIATGRKLAHHTVEGKLIAEMVAEEQGVASDASYKNTITRQDLNRPLNPVTSATNKPEGEFIRKLQEYHVGTVSSFVRGNETEAEEPTFDEEVQDLSSTWGLIDLHALFQESTHFAAMKSEDYPPSGLKTDYRPIQGKVTFKGDGGATIAYKLNITIGKPMVWDYTRYDPVVEGHPEVLSYEQRNSDPTNILAPHYKNDVSSRVYMSGFIPSGTVKRDKLFTVDTNKGVDVNYRKSHQEIATGVPLWTAKTYEGAPSVLSTTFETGGLPDSEDNTEAQGITVEMPTKWRSLDTPIAKWELDAAYAKKMRGYSDKVGGQLGPEKNGWMYIADNINPVAGFYVNPSTPFVVIRSSNNGGPEIGNMGTNIVFKSGLPNLVTASAKTSGFATDLGDDAHARLLLWFKNQGCTDGSSYNFSILSGVYQSNILNCRLICKGPVCNWQILATMQDTYAALTGIESHRITYPSRVTETLAPTESELTGWIPLTWESGSKTARYEQITGRPYPGKTCRRATARSAMGAIAAGLAEGGGRGLGNYISNKQHNKHQEQMLDKAQKWAAEQGDLVRQWQSGENVLNRENQQTLAKWGIAGNLTNTVLGTAGQGMLNQGRFSHENEMQDKNLQQQKDLQAAQFAQQDKITGARMANTLGLQQNDHAHQVNMSEQNANNQMRVDDNRDANRKQPSKNAAPLDAGGVSPAPPNPSEQNNESDIPGVAAAHATVTSEHASATGSQAVAANSDAARRMELSVNPSASQVTQSDI